ncbi:MAG: hypothetical protein L6282_01855 [Candidatus Methanoperedenaceae archaeon]|nr:hypothetical protein [Candidatus Methanoperedenaceae archaeon]
MNYDGLTDAQKVFVTKNIIRVFGKMPKNLDDIIIIDVFGYEAQYRGLIIRVETSGDKEKRWGAPDPVMIARIAMSKDVVAKQVYQDLIEES